MTDRQPEPADTPGVRLPYGRNPRIDSTWTQAAASSIPRDPHTLILYHHGCNHAVVLAYPYAIVKVGK